MYIIHLKKITLVQCMYSSFYQSLHCSTVIPVFKHEYKYQVCSIVLDVAQSSQQESYRCSICISQVLSFKLLVLISKVFRKQCWFINQQANAQTSRGRVYTLKDTRYLMIKQKTPKDFITLTCAMEKWYFNSCCNFY